MYGMKYLFTRTEIMKIIAFINIAVGGYEVWNAVRNILLWSFIGASDSNGLSFAYMATIMTSVPLLLGALLVVSGLLMISRNMSCHLDIVYAYGKILCVLISFVHHAVMLSSRVADYIWMGLFLLPSLIYPCILLVLHRRWKHSRLRTRT